jgi:hypothetical protein
MSGPGEQAVEAANEANKEIEEENDRLRAELAAAQELLRAAQQEDLPEPADAEKVSTSLDLQTADWKKDKGWKRCNDWRTFTATHHSPATTAGRAVTSVFCTLRRPCMRMQNAGLYAHLHPAWRLAMAPSLRVISTHRAEARTFLSFLRVSRSCKQHILLLVHVPLSYQSACRHKATLSA